MMIRTGIDILELSRFQKSYAKHGEKFLSTVLSMTEIKLGQARLETLAGFFSVKEAAAKAIGTGIWQEQVTWHDFEVSKDSLGKPRLELKGAALAAYEAIDGIALDISISHERSFVVANCVILVE